MTMEDAIHLPLKGKWYHMIKSGQKKDLIAQVKNLFPCGCLPFEDDYDLVWFNAFEKQYHRQGKRKKNAITFAKCRFDKRGNIVEIFKEP